MGLSNNLGKLSNMITSTGSAVGIAQASPSYTLDVTGTGRFTTSAYFATSSGSVGIGTTSPYAKLHLDNGNLGIYQASGSGTSALGGQIYLGDLNFDSSGYWDSAPGIGAVWSTANAVCGDLAFYVYNSGQHTRYERMRILSNGNVGIGTSSPANKLQVTGTAGNIVTDIDNGCIFNLNGGAITTANNGVSIQFSRTGDQLAYIGAARENTTDSSGFLSFATQKSDGTHPERMRITSGGYTKISNTGSYEYVSASIHEVRNSAADYILYGTNPNASSPSGYYISYPSASPNNTSNYFIACADSSAARFRVASNGNCYNVTGTYTSGVSDIRYKEQVTDANSQWDDIKNLRVVNFKFKKDVEENGDNALRHIGFIAQEVEKTSPHLIEEMSDEKTGETWKTIKASIIHTKAIKALQEAMAKIEQLEAKVSALENK